MGMQRKSHQKRPCSIARALDVLGDWWSPLIIRECLYGVHRFGDMHSWLGIGRNILTKRLKHLVEQGLLEKRPYQTAPPRFEYHLTAKGQDAARVLLALMSFGEAWCFEPESEPVVLYDRHSHKRVRPTIVDRDSGQEIDPRSLYAGPGPAYPSSEELRRRRFSEYFAQQSKRRD